LTYFDRITAFLPEYSQQTPVAGVHTQWLLQLHIPEDIYRRQLLFNFYVQHSSCYGNAQTRKQQQVKKHTAKVT
jgi:hypothetical protein